MVLNFLLQGVGFNGEFTIAGVARYVNKQFSFYSHYSNNILAG